MGACSTQRDTTQPTVTSGNSYVVPAVNGVASWTVTSWSTYASTDPGQTFTMKLFRQVAGPTYQAVAHDVPHDLTPGVLNTFATDVLAKPGDILGLNSGTNPGDDACNFSVTGETALIRSGDLADGQSGDFGTTTPFFRVNAAAVITPTSTFSFGKVIRNLKNGSAALPVNVPNPGELALLGKGVKSGSLGHVVATGPGAVTLRIKAKGKKRRRLGERGKVKVRPQVTFTPSGGDPRTQSLKVKLRKR
jgi:hypothetical protein